jgi:hypothetical protein
VAPSISYQNIVNVHQNMYSIFSSIFQNKISEKSYKGKVLANYCENVPAFINLAKHLFSPEIVYYLVQYVL